MESNKKPLKNADKLFINGIIYSINNKNKIYQGMAVKNGEIIGLGSNEDVKKYSNEKTEIVDLKFKVVLPGFIFAHGNLPEKLMINKDELSLFEGNNPWQYLKMIQSYVDSHPEEEVIYGLGWNWISFEGTPNNKYGYLEVFKGPHKNWLEKIETQKPIVLKSFDNHALWLNTKAFEYFKITKDTKPPIGGIIELDEEGELWGTLKGNAIYLINTDSLKEYSDMKYLNTFIKFQNKLHSYGVTSIGLIEEKRISLEIYRRLEITNKLKIKVIYGITIMPYEVCRQTICEQIHQLKRNKIIYETDLFSISIVKFNLDGIIGIGTAYLFKDYENQKKLNISNGLLMWDMVEFKDAIGMVNRLDFNTIIHASGDFACKLAVDCLEYSVNNNVKNKCRNSLIGLELITKYYIKKLKLFNINSIIKPFWFNKSNELEESEILFIGEERAQREYPVKSLVDNGVVTAGGFDEEISGELNPLNAIESAVIRNLYDFIPSGYPEKINFNDMRYRLNPSERISILEAIKMFTINGAYVLGKEDQIGSLEIGKKADFIVLDKNIFETEPLDIHEINVVQTYFNGELVYLSE
ncbi:amidohydrolase family protein [Clostridium sp. C2-6-12]|uniref:amidohydrolase n=1 Tax=Clostridium sp. C2-6-12 TaxID=2698832 RepID=UPI00136FE29A|nr:amidohydrolase family protein [Clostridium sp. C2-6-12]